MPPASPRLATPRIVRDKTSRGEGPDETTAEIRVSEPRTASAPREVTHEDAATRTAAVAGDRSAFRTLLTRHLGAVVGTARRLVGDQAEAEDIAQEAFLRLWRNMADIEIGPQGLRPWLRRVATNLAIDRIRQKKPVDVLDDVPEIAVPADQITSLATADVSERLNAALMSLPERQRQALVLFHFEGLSQIEVGRALSVSDEAVESLLARARRTLKTRLADDWRDMLETLTEAGDG
jgi:RNA polymerase sigma-70 factor, ECF subfamily